MIPHRQLLEEGPSLFSCQCSTASRGPSSSLGTFSHRLFVSVPIWGNCKAEFLSCYHLEQTVIGDPVLLFDVVEGEQEVDFVIVAALDQGLCV